MKKFSKVLAVLMAGLAISAALIFTGCTTGNDPGTRLQPYTVTQGTITGQGNITADKEKAAEGDTVTLTIAPATGWELQTLTVTAEAGTDPTVSGSGDSRTFTMPPSNVTFSGVFVETASTYAITKGTIIGQGDITANKERAATGDTVTLTIDAQTGWALQSVTVTAATGTNPDVSGNGNTRTFTMPASNVTFSGVFVETANTYTITKGTITGEGDITADEERAAEGDTVTLTDTPESGWILVEVTVTAENGDHPTVTTSGNTHTFTMPASNVTFSGEFVQPTSGTYAIIKGTITGEGDISTDKNTAAAGETVTLAIDAQTGWALQTLTVTAATGANPTVSGNGATHTFTMPASNVTFSGVFVETANTYTVTKGTITGQGDITADEERAAADDTVTLTIAPATGWELQSVVVTAATGTNPNVSGNGNTRTFTMPASNVTFSGTFIETANTYTVTQGTITGQGSITADKANAAANDTVTLTIAPATGWELQSVTVTAAAGTNPNVSGNGNTRTFTMPASNVTFSGVFKQQDENIAITLVDPDALSEDITPVPVADASQVTFTVSGNYHDYQWYLDGDKLNETGASLTLYKNVVGTDPRHIMVIALDADDTPYSGAVLFQFN